MQFGHRVAQRVAQRVVVPLTQLLTEILHREAAVQLAIQTQAPLSATGAPRSDGQRRRSDRPPLTFVPVTPPSAGTPVR